MKKEELQFKYSDSALVLIVIAITAVNLAFLYFVFTNLIGSVFLTELVGGELLIHKAIAMAIVVVFVLFVVRPLFYKTIFIKSGNTKRL